MIHDLHVHSTLSDGFMGLDDIHKIAKRNFLSIGIADHISPYHQIKDEKSFAAYRKALSGYDFLKGGEICLGAKLDISRSSLDQLDYIIGSLHAVKFDPFLTLFFFDQRVRFPDVKLFIETYTDRLVGFLNTERVDILGHPMLMPLFLQGEDLDRLFTPDQIARIVEAGVKNNVAFEISGRWRLPTENFLRECKRRNAGLAIGSDGHSPDSIGDFDYSLKMMDKIALDRDLIFVPKRK